MRRGQGISINVIVISALALIVLIVLTVVFTSRVQIFGKGATEVETGTHARFCAQQGTCQSGENPCPGKEANTSSQGWIDCSATCCKP